MERKLCNTCFTQKDEIYFIRSKTLCKDCHNEKRRQKYKENPEHREKLVKMATDFKRNKTIIRQAEKQAKQDELAKQIGETNTKANWRNKYHLQILRRSKTENIIS